MINIKNYIKNFKKNRRRYKIRHNKFIRMKVREYQRYHNGKHPNLKLIPDGYYCHGHMTDLVTEGNNPPVFKYGKFCPFYERVEIKENYPESFDHNPGLVAVGQTWIGKCNFLRITDNDLNGWGLLWDECKECGINIHIKNMDDGE